jgi:hypothetical protein
MNKSILACLFLVLMLINHYIYLCLERNYFSCISSLASVLLHDELLTGKCPSTFKLGLMDNFEIA